MQMLSKLKRWFSREESEARRIAIYAPLSGTIVPMESVPDPVFAEKIVGDGIAIDPTGNLMVAPFDGIIGKIFETNHAFSIQSATGIELFVHFGIDTVELKGSGFKRIGREGAFVKRGDPIIQFDLEGLKREAKSTLTPVIVANSDIMKRIEKLQGEVVKGESIIMCMTV